MTKLVTIQRKDPAIRAPTWTIRSLLAEKTRQALVDKSESLIFESGSRVLDSDKGTRPLTDRLSQQRE